MCDTEGAGGGGGMAAHKQSGNRQSAYGAPMTRASDVFCVRRGPAASVFPMPKRPRDGLPLIRSDGASLSAGSRRRCCPDAGPG